MTISLLTIENRRANPRSASRVRSHVLCGRAPRHPRAGMRLLLAAFLSAGALAPRLAAQSYPVYACGSARSVERRAPSPVAWTRAPRLDRRGRLSLHTAGEAEGVRRGADVWSDGRPRLSRGPVHHVWTGGAPVLHTAGEGEGVRRGADVWSDGRPRLSRAFVHPVWTGGGACPSTLRTKARPSVVETKPRCGATGALACRVAFVRHVWTGGGACPSTLHGHATRPSVILPRYLRLSQPPHDRAQAPHDRAQTPDD